MNTTLNRAIYDFPDVPMLLKNVAASLETAHDVYVDVLQRFEVANDTNRLWIVIYGQTPEIAWTLIYNLVIKDGCVKLTPNCNRTLFAVTSY